MSTTNAASYGHRWVVLLLICLMVYAQLIAWLTPAPLLTAIQDSLHVDIGKAGTLVTLITLVSGLCMFAGSAIIDRLGLRAAAILAMSFILVGSGLSFLVESYWQIVVLRIVVGIGIGFSTPLPGALTSVWFPTREQPYINSLYNVFSFVAMAAAFGIPSALLAKTGRWDEVLSILAGTVSFVALIAWVILGRDPPVESIDATAHADHRSLESGLAQSARRPEIRMLVCAMVGEMWAFNTFSTYLPSFLETTRGLTRIEAGGLSSILPLAGMAGALLCGVGTGMLGRRKPFLWPLMVLALIASLAIINLPVGPGTYLSIAALGFATAGLSPPMMTVVMELKGATREFTGGAFALIYGVSFVSSFFVSPAYGALVPLYGARLTMTLFSLPLILSIVTLMLLPETGPKGRVMRKGALLSNDA